ncbi:MAG TPA: ABC transporter ATP-binding protein [Polyangiaceae bacterium]|jgi:ABC-2 type transport system ATP-binding protein
MSDTASALRCRGLVKKYDGKVLAVDGLDLEVPVGECFGLLGPNGAGKTTTVEILEGLLQPTSGDVEVLGMRWATDERRLRERLGVSLQQTHLPERLSVNEVLSLFRSFFTKGRSPEEVLRAVSLEEKRDAWYEKLSGGQKQRLAVACALVGDPDLLFLDEPTTGLDPQSRLQLWDVVEEFKKDRRTVLITTHYMDEAERLCDRVGVVDHGKLIALGTPRELIASLGGQEVIEVTLVQGALDEAAVGALPGIHGVRRVADGFALAADPLHVALPALVDHLRGAGLTLERLSTRHATLEDVFVALTGRHLRD